MHALAESPGAEDCTKTVGDNLHKAGYTKKIDIWVSHEYAKKYVIDRISICELLLNRNKIDSFPKLMVTGDKRWIVAVV